MEFQRLRTIFLTLVIALSGVAAHAFTRSEDELMRSEIQEAKARARDFKAQQDRAAKAERDREVSASEIKVERAQAEENQERSRVRFIEIRNSLPNPEAEAERLESNFLERKEREEKQMELTRQSYLRKRAAVQKTIEQEALIDGNEEFGLK